MHEFRRFRATWLIAPALLAAGPVAAQDAERESDFRPRFEFTPYLGYRFGGEFDYEDAAISTNIELGDATSFGVSLGLYRDRGSYYELYYGHQTAPMQSDNLQLGDVDLTTEYFHVGGTLLFRNVNWFTPYLSMTAGVTRFLPESRYRCAPASDGETGGAGRLPRLSHLRGFLQHAVLRQQRWCGLRVPHHRQQLLPGRRAARADAQPLVRYSGWCAPLRAAPGRTGPPRSRRSLSSFLRMRWRLSSDR